MMRGRDNIVTAIFSRISHNLGHALHRFNLGLLLHGQLLTKASDSQYSFLQEFGALPLHTEI